MEKVNDFLKKLIFQILNLKHTSFRFSMKHKEEKTQERNGEKKRGFGGGYNEFYKYIFINSNYFNLIN